MHTYTGAQRNTSSIPQSSTHTKEQKHIWIQTRGYSHSLYCCSWVNSAGLKHTQLPSPILPEARGEAVCLGMSRSTSAPKGIDGYPWVKSCNKTEARGFGSSSLPLYKKHLSKRQKDEINETTQ